MSGYQLVLRIRRLEEQLHNLGMRWGHDKHGWVGEDISDRLSVFPRDQELPVYSRDAALFTGTINEVDRWLQGVAWSRDYDLLMRVHHKDRRGVLEDRMRNEQLVKLIKSEEVVTKDTC